MNFRPLRVSNLIRDELGALLARDLDIPPGIFVTITQVDVSKKMDIAHVRVSVLPSSKAMEVFAKLRESRGELQYQMVRKLNIKPMPHIEFSIDRGPENAAAVEKALLDE